MTVLVTGASGLTGAEIVRRLLAQGSSVVAVVRDPARAHLVPTGARIAVADCADPEAMHPLLAAAGAIVHVAGVVFGQALARAAGLGAPPRLVVISSAGVLSRHRAAAALYQAGEDAIRAVRPDALVVRPTMIYGSARDRNVHHVIRFARRLRFLPVPGDGSGLIQPIHFEDLAPAVVTLLGTTATGIVEAGGAEPLPLREAASAILRALGLPERLIHVPMGPALRVAQVVDLAVGSHSAERLRRMTELRTADNSRLVQLSGTRPRDFRTGVRDQVQRMAREERGS